LCGLMACGAVSVCASTPSWYIQRMTLSLQRRMTLFIGSHWEVHTGPNILMCWAAIPACAGVSLGAGEFGLGFWIGCLMF